MFPIGDENPTLRTPIVTYAILFLLGAVWIFFQGAGFDAVALARSVCELGLVPGELTKRALLGEGVPIGAGMACVVDDHPINVVTPVTSMFLHGSWGHLIGNALFLWVFGNNVEDSMGRFRFVIFYLLCGLAAAGAQVLVSPGSPIPMVGASGAISGVMGGYLVLYPRVRVRLLVFFFVFVQIIRLPAYAVLLWWIAWQVIAGLPQLSALNPDVSAGVAFWAHIGGFVAGALLIKLFESRSRVQQRNVLRHRLHPLHP